MHDARALLTKTGVLRCVSTSFCCQKRCVIDALLTPRWQSATLLPVVRPVACYEPQWRPRTCVRGLQARAAALHAPSCWVVVRGGVGGGRPLLTSVRRARARTARQRRFLVFNVLCSSRRPVRGVAIGRRPSSCAT